MIPNGTRRPLPHAAYPNKSIDTVRVVRHFIAVLLQKNYNEGCDFKQEGLSVGSTACENNLKIWLQLRILKQLDASPRGS